MIVMNLFDPCATWTYSVPPAPPTPTLHRSRRRRLRRRSWCRPRPKSREPYQAGPNQPTWQVIETQPFEADTWPGQWQVSDANGATNGEYLWVAAPCRVFAARTAAWPWVAGPLGAKRRATPTTRTTPVPG